VVSLIREIVIGLSSRSSPKVLDFPIYNSKGKASHTIEGKEREGKEKPKREGGGVPEL
jgi:hypothetical protein